MFYTNFCSSEIFKINVYLTSILTIEVVIEYYINIFTGTLLWMISIWKIETKCFSVKGEISLKYLKKYKKYIKYTVYGVVLKKKKLFKFVGIDIRRN